MSSNIVVKKPVVCPKCNEEIDTLRETKIREATGTLTRDSSGDYFFEVDTYLPEFEEELFCPNCENKLFDNEDDAIEFLEGDK